MNHLTARQKEAIAEASRDRPNFAARLEPVLSLDGRAFAEGEGDFVDLVDECRYGEDGDGIAVVLTATLLGRLSPRDYEQTECRVDWLVTRDDGTVEMCPGFLGEIKVVTRQGMFTSIVAATEGSEASETPIGDDKADDREYSGFRPDTVLFDILSTLNYRGIEIPRIPAPVLDARDEPFSWTRPVGEVVAWVEEQARVKAADLPWNVASAYALRPADGEPDWEVVEGEDCQVGEIADETPDGERFARVVVVRQEPDGTETPLAEAKVDNAGRRVNPRSVKVIPYDAETEGEEESQRTAYAVAYEEAERLSGLPANLTVPLVYPPFFLARGRAVGTATREYTREAVVSERRLIRLSGVAVDVKGKAGQLTGEGRILKVEEEPLVVPRFRPPGGMVAV